VRDYGYTSDFLVVTSPAPDSTAKLLEAAEPIEDFDLVDVDSVVKGFCQIHNHMGIQAISRPPAHVIVIESPTEAIEAICEHIARLRISETDTDVPKTPERKDPTVEDVASR
jgi:hypothetical protein